jgi:hypothetical protein
MMLRGNSIRPYIQHIIIKPTENLTLQCFQKFLFIENRNAELKTNLY